MSIKLAGYTRVEQDFESLRLTADYVAIEEDFERASVPGLVLLPASNTVLGTVLRVGPGLTEMTGISAGDRVLFTEWQGGKWAFADRRLPGGERKCLIMSSDYILAKVEA
jgi:co-chaperonin GroES (HSP10)